MRIEKIGWVLRDPLSCAITRLDFQVHVTVINTKGSKTNTRLQKQVSHGVRNTEPRGKAVRENLKGERYEHTEALRSKVYCRQSRQKYNRTAGRGHSGVLEEQAKRS